MENDGYLDANGCNGGRVSHVELSKRLRYLKGYF